MAKIILYGELAEKFSPEYRLDVSSPKDGLRALCVMVPGFQEAFSEGSYYIYVDDGTIFNIDEESFSFNIKSGDIHVLPEVIGAKRNGGLGKALIGIAMIGLMFVPGINTVVLGAVSHLGLEGGALMAAHGIAMHAILNIGIALALGGAAQMLSPKQNATVRKQSYLFNASDSNISNGSCVPLIYGEVLAAGFPISADISNAESMTTTTDSSYNAAIGGWNRIDYQIVTL